MEGYSTQYLYRIPDDTLHEGGKLKKAEIFTGEVYVTTNEISDVIAVGIPETGESAPEKVEFQGFRSDADRKTHKRQGSGNG